MVIHGTQFKYFLGFGGCVVVRLLYKYVCCSEHSQDYTVNIGITSGRLQSWASWDLVWLLCETCKLNNTYFQFQVAGHWIKIKQHLSVSASFPFLLLLFLLPIIVILSAHFLRTSEPNYFLGSKEPRIIRNILQMDITEEHDSINI